MTVAQAQPAPASTLDFLLSRKKNISYFLACMIIVLTTQQVLNGIGVVLQIMAVGLLTVLNPVAILSRLRIAWPVLLLPIFAMASTLWSQDHQVTLRYSIQLTMTFYEGIAMGASLSVAEIVSAVYVGSLVIAFGSMFIRRTGESAEGAVIIGLTGSKNQIGYLAQLLLAACPLIYMQRDRSRLIRYSVILTIPIALRLLVGAHSATATLTAIGAAVLTFGMIIIRPLPPSGRVATLVALVLVASPFVVMKDALVEQAQSISANVFKKDPTLTGRTVLWRQADRLIQEKPIIGHGYRALWVGKSVQSIGLLRLSGQKDGRGFNFHNTYRELGVDMGRVGDILFIIGFGFATLLTLYRYLRTGDYSVGFLLVMLGSLAPKTFSELIIAPFYIPVILYAIAAAVRPATPEVEGGYEVARLEAAPT